MFLAFRMHCLFCLIFFLSLVFNNCLVFCVILLDILSIHLSQFCYIADAYVDKLKKVICLAEEENTRVSSEIEALTKMFVEGNYTKMLHSYSK